MVTVWYCCELIRARARQQQAEDQAGKFDTYLKLLRNRAGIRQMRRPGRSGTGCQDKKYRAEDSLS